MSVLPDQVLVLCKEATDISSENCTKAINIFCTLNSLNVIGILIILNCVYPSILVDVKAVPRKAVNLQNRKYICYIIYAEQ